MASPAAHYKEISTSRNFKYHYYFAAPTVSTKPTLLFVHGFPSVSRDWHYQITFFKAKGYGLIVPDMLGYGGTSQPEDPKAYAHSLLARDLIDILDAEGVHKAVAVGHDWGSKTVSLLANLYQDRFLGFSFLSVGYIPPNTSQTYEQILAASAHALGYENFGYWSFFSSPDANDIVQKHNESFFDILYARDPRIVKFCFAPTGSLQVFLESDSRTPRAKYISEKQIEEYKKLFAHGMQGPFNYYKIATSDIDMNDAKGIPLESYTIKKPVFFGGTANDVIVVPALQKVAVEKFCPHATTKVFNTGHWVMAEAPDELNAALEDWLQTFIGTGL